MAPILNFPLLKQQNLKSICLVSVPLLDSQLKIWLEQTYMGQELCIGSQCRKTRVVHQSKYHSPIQHVVLPLVHQCISSMCFICIKYRNYGSKESNTSSKPQRKTMRIAIELKREIIAKFIKILEKWIYKCNFGASEPTIRFSIISYRKDMLSIQTFSTFRHEFGTNWVG